jgi:hypothetical protein
MPEMTAVSTMSDISLEASAMYCRQHDAGRLLSERSMQQYLRSDSDPV